MDKDIDDMKAILSELADGKSLSAARSQDAFDIMMSGDATPSQMGAFLMALRVRGETVEEITGAARAMRAKATRIAAPKDAIDTVGTGGDAAGTFNVSTATAIVVAGCGVPVAKHGNRAFTSKSGSADMLAALGLNLDADFALLERSLKEAKICFMMAPRHHGAMRHVAGTRVEMGTRTLFNILGPICNPALVERQLVGVFDRKWLEPIAEVLGKLGSKKAWVVHGADGLDEVTLTGPTHVAELDGGKIRTFDVTPADAGLQIVPPDRLRGGEPEENALATRAMLAGEKNPYRDFVLLNAAAALMVAGKVKTMTDGAAMAAEAVDGGRAQAALSRLIEISHTPPPEPEDTP